MTAECPREEEVVIEAHAVGQDDAGKWWVLFCVGIGTFMSAIDASVVNAILPVVQKSFGSSVALIEWVITVYLVVLSGLLLTFGRLGDIRGHKPIYIGGFLAFVLGSGLCGLAPTAGTLIAARGLQALGAAMIFANSPAILTGSFSADERGKALGLQAAMTYLGLMIGPFFGGWLTEQFSWRAVFFINVPIGVVAVLLSLRFIRRDPGKNHGERFDIPGAVTVLAGLVALLVALDQGHAWGWTSAPTLGLLALAAILLAGFVLIERAVPAPLLDLTLFRQRVFSAASASAVTNYICLYSVLFLLPFYLLEARNLGPLHAGLVLTAQPLVVAFVTPLSGAWSDRIGSRIPGTIGMAVSVVGLLMLARLTPGTPISYVAVSLGVLGFGIGMFISPNNNALMGAAPGHRQGIAGGVLATARNVGEVLGIGLAGAVFTTVMAHSAYSAAAVTHAVDAGLFAASGAAVVGTITSAVRGS